MWDTKLFKAGIAVLLLFLIIYIGSKITFIFYPFVIAFEALFVSFLIAGILYYFTYPLCDWLSNRRIPRSLAIVLVFLLIAGVFILLGLAIGPILAEEFTKLAITIPDKIDSLQEIVASLDNNPLVTRLLEADQFDPESLVERLTAYSSAAITGVVSSVSSVFDFITGFFVTVIIVPFLLFYMLKEKGKGVLPGAVRRIAPATYASQINSALAEMNKMLASYFQGLGLVCFMVGLLAYLGFLIIGLEFALLLSLFIMITNIVPFIGPFIGAIPAAFIGLLESPLMMLKVVVVIIVVQQLESLVVSPQVMGKKMALNPLAIILIVLVAGRLGGLLGIILAVPTFTVLKIIVNHLYDHFQWRQSEN